MAFKITELAADLIAGTGHIAAYDDSANPEESIEGTFRFNWSNGEAVKVEKMKAAAKAFLLKVANEL